MFTREEEREVEEMFVLRKHALSLERRSISFGTPIAQILDNYMQEAVVNVLVTSYPQQERGLLEVMRLPVVLSQPCEQELRRILDGYNKDKWAQLEVEAERGRKRLKERQYWAKGEEEAMQRLIKIYVFDG